MQNKTRTRARPKAELVEKDRPTVVMTDHVGWTDRARGRRERAVRLPDGYSVVRATRGGIYGIGGEELMDVVTTVTLPSIARARLPKGVTLTWASPQSVTRLRTPSLWEAVGAAIVRQVIRATQARVLYHRLCSDLGPTVGDDLHGFPRPDEVAACDLELLVAVGLGFKAKTLQRAAEVFALEPGLEFSELNADELVDRMLGIKGIGGWTAQVAACDYRNDWDCYPFEDLAVRQWGTANWRSQWPSSAAEFKQVWTRRTKPYTGVVTCFALAAASAY
jgi:DNA-3-methyladenine glycosylase II